MPRYYENSTVYLEKWPRYLVNLTASDGGPSANLRFPLDRGSGRAIIPRL